MLLKIYKHLRKRRFPEINIIDDNHADALALLELAKSDLK